jgi:hypothetical protein
MEAKETLLAQSLAVLYSKRQKLTDADWAEK